MQSVRVRRTAIATDRAADVLRGELGSGYEVQAIGDGMLQVRKGLERAKISLRPEPGGTVFEVTGEGVSFFPLVSLTSKLLNDRGIAKKAATVIGEAEAFRDDG
jgi:hypothetical protein